MNPPSVIYDIAIIGGGIAGAGIARDAALRGIRVALFEKNTFGSGTSSKSSKLIHGGLRYLEIAWKALLEGRILEFWKNFRFVFLALRETHILQKTAPGLITPIPLLIPIYQQGRRSRLAVYFGTLIYGLLSRLSGGDHFTQILNSKEAVLNRAGSLNPEGLLGGVLVWDHTTDDQALVHKIMASAVEHTALAYERAEVTDYHFNLSKKYYELSVSIQGVHEIFYARKIINASGPWVDKIRELGNERRQDLIVPVAGSHVHVKKFCETSVILEAEDGRPFFVINRGDEARIGTTERMHFNPDTVEPTADEVSYLLQAVKKFFPGVSLEPKDVLQKDAGIRPLARPEKASMPNQISREHEIVTGPTGVLHVLGVKLTDHRRAAEEIVDKLIPEIKTWNPDVKSHSLTRETPL